MQQIVLLLSLYDLHPKLSVLLFLLHSHKLTQNVFEKVIVLKTLFSFLHNLIEHIFESYHVKRRFFEREFHDFGEDKYKMLDVYLFVG